MQQAPQTTIIYEPDQRVRMGLSASCRAMVASLAQSRELIWQLFRRDFLASTKQSALGLLWIVIAPVIGIMSWVFMNSIGVLQPGTLEVPYPMYVLFGTTIWGLFMAFYTASATSLTSAGGLLIQAKFSHEALVAQQMAQAVLAVFANVTLLLIVWSIFGTTMHWTVMFFPFSLIPLLLLGTGMGMVVSVFAVIVRDMTKAGATVLGLAMFTAPVVYGPDIPIDWLQRVIHWNPLTYLVGGARDIVLRGRIEHLSAYVGSVVLTLLIFVAAWRFFFISEQKVVERL